MLRSSAASPPHQPAPVAPRGGEAPASAPPASASRSRSSLAALLTGLRSASRSEPSRTGGEAGCSGEHNSDAGSRLPAGHAGLAPADVSPLHRRSSVCNTFTPNRGSSLLVLRCIAAAPW